MRPFDKPIAIGIPYGGDVGADGILDLPNGSTITLPVLHHSIGVATHVTPTTWGQPVTDPNAAANGRVWRDYSVVNNWRAICGHSLGPYEGWFWRGSDGRVWRVSLGSSVSSSGILTVRFDLFGRFSVPGGSLTYNYNQALSLQGYSQTGILDLMDVRSDGSSAAIRLDDGVRYDSWEIIISESGGEPIASASVRDIDVFLSSIEPNAPLGTATVEAGETARYFLNIINLTEDDGNGYTICSSPSVQMVQGGGGEAEHQVSPEVSISRNGYRRLNHLGMSYNSAGVLNDYTIAEYIGWRTVTTTYQSTPIPNRTLDSYSCNSSYNDDAGYETYSDATLTTTLTEYGRKEDRNHVLKDGFTISAGSGELATFGVDAAATELMEHIKTETVSVRNYGTGIPDSSSATDTIERPYSFTGDDVYPTGPHPNVSALRVSNKIYAVIDADSNEVTYFTADGTSQTVTGTQTVEPASYNQHTGELLIGRMHV